MPEESIKGVAPTVDVYVEDIENPVKIPGGGLARGWKKVGQITKERELLLFEIQFLQDAIDNIKKASPDQMLHCLEIVDDQLELLRHGINRTLNSYGDHDPRHDPADIARSYEAILKKVNPLRGARGAHA